MDATAEAIGHFIPDLALALEPENVNLLHCVVSALTWTGHTHERLSYAKEAIRIRPRFGMAHYACGNAWADLGLIAEAIAHYENFHRLEPSSFLAYGTYYRLARAYFREGNSNAAEAALAKSLSLNAVSAPV